MGDIRRIFVGWQAPLLVSTAEYLAQHGRGDRAWDLRRVLVVVPGRRAAGRLAEILRWHAEEQDAELRLPPIVTLGDLPERLYRPPRPLASELEQTLAWSQVLVATSDEQLRPILATPLPREPVAPWIDLAATLRQLHEDLAAEGISFAEVREQVENDLERQRWQLIERLQQRYLQSLHQAGRSDPHAARREAIDQRRCRRDGDVVLAGVQDMPQGTCDLLSALAATVTALIPAPPSEAESFDGFGRVAPAAWETRPLAVTDRHLISAGDATEQAEAAVGLLAEWGQNFSADMITIGVTDEPMIPILETELAQCGLATHRQPGRPLAHTAPGRLLSLLADHLANRSWRSLAALVRHADLYGAIDRDLAASANESSHDSPVAAASSDPAAASVAPASRPCWLTQLDQLMAGHFPMWLDQPIPPQGEKLAPDAAVVLRWVDAWIADLDQSPRPLAGQCAAIERMVQRVYSDRERLATTEKELAAALESLDEVLRRFAEVTESLDVPVPAAAALDLINQRLLQKRLVLPGQAEAVELAGWLDLAHDDAPAMVVVGMNEPFVPESVRSDPFLPAALRSRLRLADHETRYARDAHSLQLIVASRPAVRLIVGRSAVDGSPTPPSRLLAACSGDMAVERMRGLLRSHAPPPRLLGRWSGREGPTLLEVPVPHLDPARPPVRAISVTAFRVYLECPYRFYLRHVMKLRPLEDAARELPANLFGDLVHAAVEGFGESADRDATEADRILQCLEDHLDHYARDHFGSRPAPAVRLQIDQARRRLEQVALCQAERIRDGWQIHQAEAAVEIGDGAEIVLEDGRRLSLVGRVDRIDRHEDGRWAILDYKTHGHSPMKKHLVERTGQWLDLQLPIYRHMLRSLGIDAPADQVQLGYFNIAQKPSETGVHLAPFTAEQLADADRLAREVVRGILDGRFDFDPSRLIEYDDYAAICQTGIAQSLLAEDDEEVTA